VTKPARCRLMCIATVAATLHACGGSSPTAPSSPRLQVTFTSQAPDRCTGPCLRLAWVDAGSVGQGLLKIAVQVQNIPARGISSASNILSGKISGTFSQSSSSFVFSTSNAGDFFERLGKPVRYEVSDLGTLASNCCLTTYDVGFPTPAPTDRVSGDGTIVVLIYTLKQAGLTDLDPGIGVLGDVFTTTYTAQVRVSGS
jgi:hypothetical protein